jgi:transposase
VARAVLREKDLPIATHDLYSRDIKLLVDRRDDLVAVRTATINRLLDRLHELDPTAPPTKLRLKVAKHRAAVASLLETHRGVLADLARNELAEIADLSVKVDLIEKRLKDLVSVGAPSLISVNGCGPLMAAKIVGETAGIGRFNTEAKYARYSGVAPVPNWSGSTMGRVQSIKTGNRQINRALHTIAMMQIRKGGRGEQYYRRRVSEGDSHAQAIRRVKRQVCRAVYYCQIADAATRATSEPAEVPQP